MADDIRALLGRLKATAEARALTPGPWIAVNEGSDKEPMMNVKAARIAGRPAKHWVAIIATGDSPQAMENANAAHIATFDPPTVLRLIALCEAALLQAERHPTDTIAELHAALRALKEHAHDR